MNASFKVINVSELYTKNRFSDWKPVLNLVSDAYKISLADIESNSRLSIHVEARCVAAELIRRHCAYMTLKKLGAIFNRDHSTVCYLRDKYGNLMYTDKRFRVKFLSLEERVMRMKGAAA